MNPFYSRVPSATTAKNFALTLVLVSASLVTGAQQAVSAVITDYNSYWKSSAAAVNAVKPSNNHNLLAFTYNGTQYSTGVNDALLSSRGESYVQSDFWALPVEAYTGSITPNTKVGLGEMFDGIHNGPSTTAPENNISRYLTDGVKGLNIGTCIANLPAGTLTFTVSNVKASCIGDGIPDIVVTQVADPSGSFDSYSFLDENNVIVGTSKNIVFTSITPVANWTADFYEASTLPMVLIPGFTNTDRPMRLWAADLSDFGITAANFSQVRRFSIALSGNSDVAFVAYNNKTFNVQVVLPIKLSDFSAQESNGKATLSWATQTEINSNYFVVEKSTDNTSFVTIDTVNAAGNSTTMLKYSSSDNKLSTVNYYRLKMVDADGKTEYSKTAMVRYTAKNTGLTIFPNPAVNQITVTHTSKENGTISIHTAQGLLVKKVMFDRNVTQTSMDVSAFAKGIYCLVMESATEKSSKMFVVK